MRSLTALLRSALAALLLTFGITSLQAQEPVELVEQLYASYVNPDAESPLPPLISEEAASDTAPGYLTGDLQKAVAALAKAQEANPEISLGYDPLVDAQDFEIKNLKVTPVAGSPAEVKVEFENFGEKRAFLFRFVKPEGGDRWLLADVICQSGSEARNFDLHKELEEALKTPAE